VSVRPDRRGSRNEDLLTDPHGAAEPDHRLERRPRADTRAHPRRLAALAAAPAPAS
jgi:hypothetical protein